MRRETLILEVVGHRAGLRQRWRRCCRRFERDEVEYAAVEARPSGVSIVGIVTIVRMHVRRM